jgi:serpin B
MKAIASLSLISIVIASLGAQPAPAQVKPGGDGSAAMAAVVSANNAFALDLYRQLAGQAGNLFFSPYSTESALAMTFDGARGQTADELAKVLRLPGAPDTINAGFGALIGELDTSGAPAQRTPYQLVVANALWGQEGYAFQEGFQDVVRKQYRAEVSQVDFKAADTASRQINGWVAGKTSNKIQDIIQPGMLSADTRLVLANAIYFKSRWADEFSNALTKDAPFYPAPAAPVSVPMMNRQGELAYAETDDLQVLQLPYSGARLSMAIILPKKTDGLPALEESLTGAQLDQLLAQGQERVVNVTLPKFTFTSEFSLGDTLKAMGAACAFTPECADFSGMLNGGKVSIGAVIHKAYVAVDEKGTEAAAATAIVMLGAEYRRQTQEPVVFKADHPFLFLIRHNPTRTILFLGRVANPKP